MNTPTPGRTTAGTFLGREPVLWTTAIRAVLYAIVLFGVNLTDAQIVGALVAVEAILALVVRSQATPNVSVLERKSDGVVYAGHGNEIVPAGVVVRRVDRPVPQHLSQTDEEAV